MKKTIFFGLACLIFFALFELFSFSILKIYSKLTTVKPQIKITSGYKYIEAEDIPEKKKEYHAFYGWRGYYSDNKFKVRQTLENKKWNKKNQIYFFGGSTVLGAGTTFDKTIPSHFANLSHYYQPINMGEHSYVSGQSLNRLIEIIDEIKKDDIVVFYEGVNDVTDNCQKHLGVNGHSKVSLINKLLKNQNNSFLIVYNNFLRNFRNTNSFKFINGVSKKIFNYNLNPYFKEDNFICNNKTNAFKVAKNLTRHWNVAETISKKKGAKFYAFLQPSPYTADFELSRPSRVMWKKSYDYVYPILRKLISDKENYFDISKSLNKDFYVDWCCHMHSDGNEFISNKIFNLILK
jgi:hypothetical protein